MLTKIEIRNNFFPRNLAVFRDRWVVPRNHSYRYNVLGFYYIIEQKSVDKNSCGNGSVLAEVSSQSSNVSSKSPDIFLVLEKLNVFGIYK